MDTIFEVTRGNRAIGIAIRQRLVVLEATPIKYLGNQVKVRFLVNGVGPVRVLWARSVKTMGKEEFNLGDGTGVNSIRVGSWKVMG